MSAEFILPVIVHITIIAVAIILIIKGKTYRTNKSSRGISASSNETSTGTALIVCGGLLLVFQTIKLINALFLST